MDGATIHGKIYAGRAKAALRLGLDYHVYRPTGAANPLTNLVTTLKAAFNSGDNTYAKPNLFNDPIWFGDFDGNQTLPGDYLARVSDGNIYYIAGQQQLLPIICVDCDRTLKITRGAVQNSVGVGAYGGRQPSLDTVILGSTTPWPCSILLGGRRESTGVNLPSDTGNTGYLIKLPPSVPITVNAGDIASDDLGRRYLIEGAELTDLGYRIIANEVHS